MIQDDEFKRWIAAAHSIFEIFEGRYDVYPSKKWIDEWFENGEFMVFASDNESKGPSPFLGA